MEEKPKIDLGEVDKLDNIETARMALRWALERLHTLETAKAEASERLGNEAKWRAQAEEEARHLKSSLALKIAQAEDRERYYKRVEEFLSLRLAGKVDIAALAQREAEVTQLRQDLENRIGQLEREFAARRQSLELEYQRLCRGAREAAQSGAKDAQAYALKRHEEFEHEHASKLVAAKERELRVAKDEADLAERQHRFDEFAAAQKQRLEAQARELEEQAKLRLATTERILEERHASAEAGWMREKALLLQEIALLRRKVQETSPALLEADRRAEEAGAELAFAQEGERRAEAKARLAQIEHGAIVKRLEETSSRLEAELTARADLERRAVRAETDFKDARTALEGQRLLLAQRERELALEKEAFRLAELEKAAPEKVAALRAELTERAMRAEERFAQEKESLLTALRERDEKLAAAEAVREKELEDQRRKLTGEWEERRRAAEEQEAAWEQARLEEAAAWRRRLDEATARAADLQGRLSEAEDEARASTERADLESKRNRSLGEHSETTLALWRQEWETERRGLLSKIADLENTTRKADAEREEQSRAIESMGAARRAELDEQHHAELTRLTDDRAAWEAACRRELQQWHGRADEAARKLSEMESALEIARASETRAHEAAHAEAALARQHAQEAEKRLAEARTHFDVMLANIEADRQRERQDFERLLAERDQAEAKVHEELRSTKLALEEADRRRLREMEEATADRFTAERALGEQARAAVNRVSELEKALADSEPVMRRAQQVLAEETERNRRYEQRFEEQKRHLEEREAAMLNELREREDELTRRAAEVEASAARTAADYRERRLELDKLKADFERHLGELVRKARG